MLPKRKHIQSFTLDDECRKRLEYRARLEQRSLSNLVRWLILKHLAPIPATETGSEAAGASVDVIKS